MYVCMYVCVCMCVYICVCMYVCVCVCMYVCVCKCCFKTYLIIHLPIVYYVVYLVFGQLLKWTYYSLHNWPSPWLTYMYTATQKYFSFHIVTECTYIYLTWKQPSN